MESNRDRKTRLIAEVLKSIPDIDILLSEKGFQFTRPEFDDYKGDYDGFMEAYRKGEAEAKAYYKKAKAALDRFSAKNPAILAKGEAVKLVAGISTHSADLEYFGFTYTLTEADITFTLVRMVNSNKVGIRY